MREGLLAPGRLTAGCVPSTASPFTERDRRAALPHDRWCAFDEVLQYGDLDPRVRLMTQLAAMIATGSLAEFRAMLGGALTIGVTPIEAKEVVYRAVPYVGLTRVVDFLHATNEILTGRGVDLPTRELLTFSMLAALGGADAQVKGHVAANLRVGNDRAVLLAVLTRLLPFIGYPRTLNALAAINEVAPADSTA